MTIRVTSLFVETLKTNGTKLQGRVNSQYALASNGAIQGQYHEAYHLAVLGIVDVKQTWLMYDLPAVVPKKARVIQEKYQLPSIQTLTHYNFNTYDLNIWRYPKAYLGDNYNLPTTQPLKDYLHDGYSLSTYSRIGGQVSFEYELPIFSLVTGFQADKYNINTYKISQSLLSDNYNLAGIQLHIEKLHEQYSLAIHQPVRDLLGERYSLPILKTVCGITTDEYLLPTVITLIKKLHDDYAINIASQVIDYLHDDYRIIVPALAYSQLSDQYMIDANQAYETTVINYRTQGVTNYTDLVITDVITSGELWAMSDRTGLYLLDSDTDNGEPINAEIQTGQLDFNSPLLKRVRGAIIGSDFLGQMVISLSGDSLTSGPYKLQQTSNGLGNGRSKFARGIKARYWDINIKNFEGSTGVIRDVELVVDGAGRNIKVKSNG